MNKVRLGIIGLGNIGKYHADYLSKGKVSRCELTAVCDAFAPLESISPCGHLATRRTVRSGEVDAVIIATPHYQHTTLGHRRPGSRPACHGREADLGPQSRCRAADCGRKQRAKQVFAGMFQLRTEPRYLKIQKLIHDGDLGELARINWIITDWYRTEAYYASGGWRATWKGEGGGVLLNQCLHNLDTLAWLCGMPERVRGFCELGRYHQIEVEDDVTLTLSTPTARPACSLPQRAKRPGPIDSKSRAPRQSRPGK